MSGLGKNVRLKAKKSKIIISKASNPRTGWEAQIKKEIASNGLPSSEDEYGDLNTESEATLKDGLTD
jgi:hypothetical protein